MPVPFSSKHLRLNHLRFPARNPRSTGSSSHVLKAWFHVHVATTQVGDVPQELQGDWLLGRLDHTSEALDRSVMALPPVQGRRPAVCGERVDVSGRPRHHPVGVVPLRSTGVKAETPFGALLRRARGVGPGAPLGDLGSQFPVPAGPEPPSGGRVDSRCQRGNTVRCASRLVSSELQKSDQGR